jgi:hypothetical protein
VFPIGTSMSGNIVGYTTSQERRFCASCRVMTPYTDDSDDPNSTTLAATHARSPWFVARAGSRSRRCVHELSPGAPEPLCSAGGGVQQLSPRERHRQRPPRRRRHLRSLPSAVLLRARSRQRGAVR